VRRLSAWLGSLALACGARTELGVPVSSDAGTDVVVIPPTHCTFDVPTQLATTGSADEIIVQDGFVYWIDEQGIHRVATSGGSAMSVTTTPPGFWPAYDHFVIDGPDVVWLMGQELGKAPLGGGPSQPIISSLAIYYTGVVVGSSGLWVWEGGGPACQLSQVVGGNLDVLTTSLPFSTEQMIVVGSTLYGGSANNGAFMFTGSGGLMSFGTAAVADLAWDGTALFFTEYPGSGGKLSVWRVTPEAGGATAITPASYGSLGGIAVTQENVYFGSRDDGSVERVGKDGTALTVIHDVPDTQAIGVAVDASCVYWVAFDNATNDSGSIWVAPQ